MCEQCLIVVQMLAPSGLTTLPLQLASPTSRQEVGKLEPYFQPWKVEILVLGRFAWGLAAQAKI